MRSQDTNILHAKRTDHADKARRGAVRGQIGVVLYVVVDNAYTSDARQEILCCGALAADGSNCDHILCPLPGALRAVAFCVHGAAPCLRIGVESGNPREYERDIRVTWHRFRRTHSIVFQHTARR